MRRCTSSFAYHCLAASLLLWAGLAAAQVPATPHRLPDSVRVSIHVVATLPNILRESSGLQITDSGWLWSHNDDRLPVLYALDSANGKIMKAIHLNHPNNGWEALARDDRKNLYIGAFGNNDNNRRDLSILRIPDPEKITEEVVNAELIQFHYPDQREFPPSESARNFDADAFVSLGDSLFLFTKNRTHPFTGYTKVYRLPQSPGKYEATLYDSLFLSKGPMMNYWVTGADISADGKWLALLSHDCIWLVWGFSGKRFSTGQICRVPLNNLSHKAGISFSSSGKRVFVSDELEFGFLGGKLYSVDLTRVMDYVQQNFNPVAAPVAEPVDRTSK